MSGNENENENKLSMEENQQQHEQNLQAISYACETLQRDRENVLSLVKQNGWAFEFASELWKGDREIVLTAVKQNWRAFKFASEPLRGDREIVLTAVKRDWRALRYASELLKDDREIVLTAVKQYGSALQYASKALKGDREIVLTAVKQDGLALKYASELLKGDREIVLTAVKQDWFALEYASKLLKGDREIVLTAVKQNGWALEYASETLKGDREVVLTAVKQNGMALQFASETLKGDSNSLKADKEVVLVAVRDDCNALKYANDALKQDRDCLIAAGIWDENYPAASIGSSTAIDIHPPASFSRNRRIFRQQHFILSTRYSLGKDSRSIATSFTKTLNKNEYIQDNNVKIFSPNAYCKSTCDPKWTRMSWPCRGTFESCQFGDHLKQGEPHDGCCWRYSFRWHLQKAKKRNGIMLQVVDLVNADVSYEHGLGDGQKIEKLMAEEIGIKVFRFYKPFYWMIHGDDFRVKCVNALVKKIMRWYDDGCTDMTPGELEGTWEKKDCVY